MEDLRDSLFVRSFSRDPWEAGRIPFPVKYLRTK